MPATGISPARVVGASESGGDDQPGTSAAGSTPDDSQQHAGDGRPKRASAACTRCRRYRQKCIMSWEGGRPVVPCKSCAGISSRTASQCAVLPRGHSAADRSFRRRRRPSDAAEGEVPKRPRPADQGESKSPSGTSPAGPVKDGEANLMTFDKDHGLNGFDPDTATPMPRPHDTSLLPPHDEIVDGVRAFLFSYFQLGFLPRAFFLERVEQEPQSISPFLLLAILSVSARFTPALIRRYGGRKAAAAEMRRRAMGMMGQEMMGATVERMQALFLLGVSDFGEGHGGRSWLLTGIAIRMAATMRLHRESSYTLQPNATPEDAIRAETARRSFWLVYCHDQQIAGRSPSTTFPLATIDALLPAEEDDFIYGQLPLYRAALPGTAASGLSTQHQPDPHRSLFATMIIGQWLWARTAEQACRVLDPFNVQPWDPNGDFAQLDRELRQWEQNLPARHSFSNFTLRVNKGQNLDLGFVSIHMLLCLSHIVLRRAFLPCMARAFDDHPSSTAGAPPLNLAAPPEFWASMALQMVESVVSLHNTIQSTLATRSAMDGFPAVFIFGVYMCGDIAYYLYRWPRLCPQHATAAPAILHAALSILGQLEEAWPLATRWRVTLQHLVSTSSTSQTFLSVAAASHSLDEESDIYRQPRLASAERTSLAPSSPLSVMQPPQHTQATPSSIHLPLTPSRRTTDASAHTPTDPPPPPPPPLSTTFDLLDLPRTGSAGTSPALPVSTSTNETMLSSTAAFSPSSLVANVELDAFSADLGAFLRGEPVDWFNDYDQQGMGGFGEFMGGTPDEGSM